MDDSVWGIMAGLGGLFIVEGLAGHRGSPMTSQAPSLAFKPPFAILSKYDDDDDDDDDDDNDDDDGRVCHFMKLH